MTDVERGRGKMELRTYPPDVAVMKAMPDPREIEKLDIDELLKERLVTGWTMLRQAQDAQSWLERKMARVQQEEGIQRTRAERAEGIERDLRERIIRMEAVMASPTWPSGPGLTEIGTSWLHELLTDPKHEALRQQAKEAVERSSDEAE